VNCLVDTHIFLWSVISPKKIPQNLRKILIDLESTKFISVISFWEISLKFSLGKISLEGILPDKLPIIAKDSGFEILNLDSNTAASFYKLPKLRNKDPFDRMLVWQAISKNCVLLSRDDGLLKYKDQGLSIVR
jgi:PIN domain nuclease of toxin-antitoxin system